MQNKAIAMSPLNSFSRGQNHKVTLDYLGKISWSPGIDMDSAY